MTDTTNADTVQTTIGAPTGDPLIVSATFVYKEVTFTRDVNACTDASGAYDETATTARVAEHASTMKYRVDNNLLTNQPPAPTPTEETAGAVESGSAASETSTGKS